MRICPKCGHRHFKPPAITYDQLWLCGCGEEIKPCKKSVMEGQQIDYGCYIKLKGVT